MNAVAAWIMSILAIIILGVLLDLLLSNTRAHKLLQTIFATVTILIIITPVPSLIKSGFGLSDNTIFDSSLELDWSYLDYASEIKTAAIERGIVDALASDGLKNAEASVTAEFGEEIIIKQVRINIRNLVIEQNYLHINKYEYIKDKVSDYLKISKDIITVY